MGRLPVIELGRVGLGQWCRKSRAIPCLASLPFSYIADARHQAWVMWPLCLHKQLQMAADDIIAAAAAATVCLHTTITDKGSEVAVMCGPPGWRQMVMTSSVCLESAMDVKTLKWS